MRNFMSWIKNFVLLSVSGSFCFCLLVLGDWFLSKQINLAIKQQIEKSEAAKIEDTRSRNEDIPQREKLISEGFLPLVYPSLMDKLDIQFPLIAGLPLAKTYFCNEGYGLIRYQSDRFGFRNKDTIWNNNPKVIMIGDSFVHGACVSDEETLPQKLSNEINSNVVNLGISGNGPSHYFTYAYLFIPRLKPKTVYLNFYPYDNGVRLKSSIERKYVDLNYEIFENNSLSFFDTSLFFDQGMKIIELLRDEKKIEKTFLGIDVLSWGWISVATNGFSVLIQMNHLIRTRSAQHFSMYFIFLMTLLNAIYCIVGLLTFNWGLAIATFFFVVYNLTVMYYYYYGKQR